jgi:hypothetical protein
MQYAAAALGHRLAVDLEDEPEHTMRRGVLGAHVDHDALVGLEVHAGDHGVPVLAGDSEHLAGRRLLRGRVRVAHRLSHQLYALR